ncbi:acetate--CoA ligase [Enhygromyxa salina]|uniref:acetate--CoA ligase n=1 Tax=Enhygromyxa salina TaxID=215803 RepID=A0A2S9YC99_9BACT|nr:acetate--CoA ligase [Enhygromyxa salina]PRQ02725.1 Acetyl-coenzyme A synthetase [Enhygromyxa salina]
MAHIISSLIQKLDSTPVNMPDYEATRTGFDWADARAELAGLPGGGLNIAHAAVMRHARSPLADTVALRWLGKRGAIVEYSYAELARKVAQFANLLDALGVRAGATVCSFAGRLPHLYVAALGALAHRSVFCPLSPGLEPEPIVARLGSSKTKVIVTTERLYASKLAALRDRLPELEHVLLLDMDLDLAPPKGTRSLAAALRDMSHVYEIPPTNPEDPALLHFTSGTTGQPKGVLHVHEAVVGHHSSARLALDLRPGDVYWCTADPGWVTGISYSIIAPLCHGVTMIVDEANVDARRWCQIVEQQQVTVSYTAPAAIRSLMRAGVGLSREYDLSKLRFIASVGEPLDPEAVRWSIKALGQPIHDNWWQAETGSIMIANYASMPVVLGSMGKPLPGVTVGIVTRVAGGVRLIDEPGAVGELAVRAPWPSMFRAYLDQEERHESCFVDGWYLSGDLASRDAAGYIWFVGRADDMIQSAGHLIGTFAVESALLQHPAVAEVAVIGKPDPVDGACIKAFVTLAPGFAAREALRRELLGFGRARLGLVAAPRELEFCDGPPRTRSGKTMRRLLLARELGLPEGDTSTLATGSDE